MEITLTVGAKKQKIEIKQNLFEPIEFENKSICDRLPALITADKKLLILFGVNERPTPTGIAAILLDPKAQKVIKLDEHLGELWGKATINQNVIVVSAIQGSKPHPRSDGPESVIPGKLQISVKDGQIIKEWLTKAKSESHK